MHAPVSGPRWLVSWSCVLREWGLVGEEGVVELLWACRCRGSGESRDQYTAPAAPWWLLWDSPQLALEVLSVRKMCEPVGGSHPLAYVPWAVYCVMDGLTFLGWIKCLFLMLFFLSSLKQSFTGFQGGSSPPDHQWVAYSPGISVASCQLGPLVLSHAYTPRCNKQHQAPAHTTGSPDLLVASSTGEEQDTAKLAWSMVSIRHVASY